MPIRVVVADDQPIMLQALVDLLGLAPDIELVGMARDAEEAIALCELHEPDVAVVDVVMPDGGGAAVAVAVHKRALGIRVIALSALDDNANRERMAAAGAFAYLLKDGPIFELLDTIRYAATAS